MSGSEIGRPAIEMRRLALIGWGGAEGPKRWRWWCPQGCGFEVDENYDAEPAALVKMRAHRCEAGWCAVRWPAEFVHVQLPASAFQRYVTPAHRKRYGPPR